MHFYGGGFSFNQKKLPSFKAEYNGNMRSNVFGEQMMHSVNFNTGYSYKIAKTNLRTTANYQFIISNADSISFSDYTLHNVMLVQSVSFRLPVTVLATIGYNQLINTCANQPPATIWCRSNQHSVQKLQCRIKS
jgi:hypothetical protein